MSIICIYLQNTHFDGHRWIPQDLKHGYIHENRDSSYAKAHVYGQIRDFVYLDGTRRINLTIVKSKKDIDDICSWRRCRDTFEYVGFEYEEQNRLF